MPRKKFEAETESTKVAEQVQEAEQAQEQKQVAAIEAPTTGRRRKNVFNGTQSRISVNHTIPGYHLHVFTDEGNRIYEAMEAGYEFVTPEEVGGISENVVSRNSDLGDRVRYLVNPRTGEGSAKFGYLMKQREDWYKEDQAALAAKNMLIDNTIRKGKITGENPNFYVRKDGIQLKQG
jgi:hypothetical protein